MKYILIQLLVDKLHVYTIAKPKIYYILINTLYVGFHSVFALKLINKSSMANFYSKSFNSSSLLI